MLVLAYHRIDDYQLDRWGLRASAANFEAQMQQLAARFTPRSLAAIDAAGRLDAAGPDDVAVTFDHGYRDAAGTALPALKRLGIPATFFVSREGAAAGDTFWWERLDAAMEAMGLTDAQAVELHTRLATMSSEAR
jgi:peptidoglycan/xylan/chitin deacetylase (PgdA/CDA1 family)